MNACWWAVVVIGLTLASGQVARWRGLPSSPAKRAPATAEAWMVDSLPGIGATRLAPALEAVRQGRLDVLPTTSREMARQVFNDPDAR